MSVYLSVFLSNVVVLRLIELKLGMSVNDSRLAKMKKYIPHMSLP